MPFLKAVFNLWINSVQSSADMVLLAFRRERTGDHKLVAGLGNI